MDQSQHGGNLHPIRPLLEEFRLYETKSRYYIFACDLGRCVYRMLKIDRTEADLSLLEDAATYGSEEFEEVLATLREGNRSTGFKLILTFHGIIGFVRFIYPVYKMVVIVKRSPVALIGGFHIYHVDETRMIPLTTLPSAVGPLSKESKQAEARYMQIFGQVDLTRNFYYSVGYDLTRTLQANFCTTTPFKPNGMFIWNHFLLKDHISPESPFYLPICHGFVDQFKISIYGRDVFVTLIARRSRHFAGARFKKRGINDQGHVANDVETEQIVHDSTTTFCHHPRGDLAPGKFTSFIQHRGSIPLVWGQEAAPMAAKPPIEINYMDPFYTATAKHFSDMFQRYGDHIYVLNLIKQKERVPRESLLLDPFSESINYLNQFLPPERRLNYIAFDMARASKSVDQDVIGQLEDIADRVIAGTGFFHSGPEPYINAIRETKQKFTGEEFDNLRACSRLDQPIFGRRQHGVVRVNCIDCLDRTNAAQFVIGYKALGQQLCALGVIGEPYLPLDSDAVNLLNAMYHDHGDTIALQYGGSHLVNTMETYRKLSPWTSHSRDTIEKIRRYYSNSFTDAEKQDAMNLFLGAFQVTEQGPALWDLSTDFILHHEDPMRRQDIPSYTKWCTIDPSKRQLEISWVMDQAGQGFYFEYYQPNRFTSIDDLFVTKMISTSTLQSGSPFAVSTRASSPIPPLSSPKEDKESSKRHHLLLYNLNIGGVARWLTPNNKPEKQRKKLDMLKEIEMIKEGGSTTNFSDTLGLPVSSRLLVDHWLKDTGSIVCASLHPQVSRAEELVYERHVARFRCPDISSYKRITDTHSFDLRKETTVKPEWRSDHFKGGKDDVIAENHHPEYALFKGYVEKQSLGRLSVTHRDEQLYKSHAETCETLLSNMGGWTFSSFRSNEGSDPLRYEAYRLWVEEGVYDVTNVPMTGDIHSVGKSQVSSLVSNAASSSGLKFRGYHVKRNSTIGW